METVVAKRVNSASQTEGPLWRSAVMGDIMEPVDLGNVRGTAPNRQQ